MSPEIHVDGTVTFRVYAPEAESVALAGQVLDGIEGDPPPMIRNEDGVWSARVGPVEPGQHGYLFDIGRWSGDAGVGLHKPRRWW